MSGSIHTNYNSPPPKFKTQISPMEDSNNYRSVIATTYYLNKTLEFSVPYISSIPITNNLKLPLLINHWVHKIKD
jgi:hypothetical protein